MVNIEELKQENQRIHELTQVLDNLIDDENLRKNPVFCELMERFNNSVEEHLTHEDREVYSSLLNHDDHHIHDMATQFMSNTLELKRVMKDFVKNWCKAKPGKGSHGEFANTTREIFHLVGRRIELENSKLFPTISGM